MIYRYKLNMPTDWECLQSQYWHCNSLLFAMGSATQEPDYEIIYTSDF